MADFAKINQKKCNGCGLCVDNCPSRCLFLTAGSVAEVDRGKGCIACGHCEAVCSMRAITVGSNGTFCPFSSLKLENRWHSYGEGNLGELVGLMHSRRSCRSYADREVALSLLQDLTRIGSCAPSGTNSQRRVFSILENRGQVENFGSAVAGFYRRVNEKAKKTFLRFLDKQFGKGALCQYFDKYYAAVAESLQVWDERREDRLFHGAPAVIAVGSQNGASCPAEDALLAAQNILLAAHVMGLGTCLVGYAVEALRRDRILRQLIGFGEGERIYAVITLGYPAVRFNKLIVRKDPEVRYPLR